MVHYSRFSKLPILKWPTEDKPLTFCTEINHCLFPLLTVKFNEHSLGSLGCTFVSGYVPEGSASYQACCSDAFIALILSKTFNNITVFFVIQSKTYAERKCKLYNKICKIALTFINAGCYGWAWLYTSDSLCISLYSVAHSSALTFIYQHKKVNIREAMLEKGSEATTKVHSSHRG